MTTITLEVPDELAARINPIREQLPDLINKALRLSEEEKAIAEIPLKSNPAVLAETLDFLASGPTPEQIIAHKVSPAVQDRLEELLDKNREQLLTEEEEDELDTYEQVDHLMILLKARARAMNAQTN